MLLYILVADSKERTLDILERAYEIHDVNLPWIVTFPAFDNLHNEPGFKELDRKMNLLYK